MHLLNTLPTCYAHSAVPYHVQGFISANTREVWVPHRDVVCVEHRDTAMWCVLYTVTLYTWLTLPLVSVTSTFVAVPSRLIHRKLTQLPASTSATGLTSASLLSLTHTLILTPAWPFKCTICIGQHCLRFFSWEVEWHVSANKINS